MPNDKTRLSVRVDSRKGEYKTPPVVYVYHWDRIFGALAVLLLLVGGVGYAGYRWLSPTAKPVADQTVVKIEAAEEPRVQAEEQDEEPASEEPLATAPGSGEPRSAIVGSSNRAASEATVPDVGAAPDAGPTLAGDASAMVTSAVKKSSDAAAPVAGAESPAAPPAAGEASVVTTPATSAVSQAATPATESPAEAPDRAVVPRTIRTDARPAPAPLPPGQRAYFRLQDISVLSPAVERFVLAKSVINNEPRGDIESIVPKEDGAAAVYCFSDVVGMKDKVLYYHWLRGGKRVAKVRVGAWGKRWRSHSSKILNPTMKGDWRVELRKADKTLLASAEFVYR